MILTTKNDHSQADNNIEEPGQKSQITKNLPNSVANDRIMMIKQCFNNNNNQTVKESSEPLYESIPERCYFSNTKIRANIHEYCQKSEQIIEQKMTYINRKPMQSEDNHAKPEVEEFKTENSAGNDETIGEESVFTFVNDKFMEYSMRKEAPSMMNTVKATTTTTTTTNMTKTRSSSSVLSITISDDGVKATAATTQTEPSETASKNCDALDGDRRCRINAGADRPQGCQSSAVVSIVDNTTAATVMEPSITDDNTGAVQQPEIRPKSFSSIPGPWPSLPFIGTGWQYFPLIGRYDLGKLHEAHLAKFHDYGPIVREEYQWGCPMVHIFDPQDFETVFRSQGRCPVRPPNEFVTSLRSSKPEMYPNVGFANLNGEPWLELRQKLAPGIMKMRAMLETINDQNYVLDDFLDYITKGCDRETLIFDNIQEACYRLALESICLLCLGTRIGSFDSEHDDSSQNSTANRLIEATKLMFDSFNRLYYGPSFWKYFSTGAYTDLEQSETEIYNIATKHIEAEMERLIDEPDAEQKYNVLQTLLATPGLSVEDVKVTVMDFIAGGIFTVSNSLAYLCYHLASNPDVQQKLADEISQVTGSRAPNADDHELSVNDEWLTSADIGSMPYLKACVRESFRLNCPVPGIMRITSKPLILSGYEVPENTVVLSHIMSTCRLEKYFPEADRFKPERWIEAEERSKIHPFASLPFGFGSRMCVGKRFSENEIYLAAARLVSRYRIELPPGCDSTAGLELKHAFIVIPAKPISLKFIRR